MILNIGGGGGLPIRLIVTAPTGSAVSVTQGSTVLAANEVDGVWTFAIPSLGVWTIHATIEGQSLTQDVDISKVGQYNVTLEAPVKTTLNDNDWATIKSVADESKGANYWAVGDTKQITINGKLSDGLTLSNYQTWVYIIGFDHNSEKEGTGIAFGGFKTVQTGGVDVALCDSAYSSIKTSGQWFNMNNNNSTTGGWASCNMRNNTLPLVKSAMPSDLQSVLKTTTIYTDNTGGSSTAANYVTATQDELYLLAEFEIFGSRTYANSAEQDYQTQYAYYSAGNSKIKYRHDSTETAVFWWERSVHASGPKDFCRVSNTGTADYSSSGTNWPLGFVPAFKVGGVKYTPVEYISSTGTQYINTGYVPTPNTRVIIDAEVTSQTTASCSYFGERSGSGPTDKTAYEIWSMATAANVSSDFFGNRVSYTISTKQRLLIDKNKATVTINGNTVTNSAAAGTATIPAYIFASNDKGTAMYFINMKLYSCKIYENDALIHDYIPAKDEWDNAGLWDDVDKKMLYNAGSGDFGAPGIRQISSVAVGQSLFCQESGVATEFILVHKGNPDSSIYDDSCNGAWLMRKNATRTMYWSSDSGLYLHGAIDIYLEDTYYPTLNVKDIIKQAKIPYIGGRQNNTVYTGASGYVFKCFPLSFYEVGGTPADIARQADGVDGAKLDYFTTGSAGNAARAYPNAGSTPWTTRSPVYNRTNSYIAITADGGFEMRPVEDSAWVRPAFILPLDTYVDGNNILTAPPYNAISTLNVGDSVFCKEDGVDAEYLLVHKGNPDTAMYDASCNGAWLLRKTAFPNIAWNSTASSNWSTCDVMKWLRDTYPAKTNVSSIMNVAKVPYIGPQMNQIISGANGNAAKCFLLSNAEVGFANTENYPIKLCGKKLDYFDPTKASSASTKRSCYSSENESSEVSWWLRTQPTNNQSNAEFVGITGVYGNVDVSSTSMMGQMFSVRPAFIVPLDTPIDSSNNIIA